MPSFGTNVKSKYGCWTPRVIADAGSARTVTPEDFGCLITNRGGGALTVTLPTPVAEFAGAHITFFQVAAGDLVISCSEGLVGLNNATADTLTLGTANEEIGNGVTVICDGTSWLVQVHLAAEAVTTVVGDS